MKALFLTLLFTPLFLSAQESINYTSPLSSYVSDSLRFEHIDRVITLKNDTITFTSKGKDTTDIQTWIILEKIKKGSDFVFECISEDRQYHVFIKVYDYLGKVKRIEIFNP